MEDMEKLTEIYWNKRWMNGETGWGIGYASPAIVSYFKTIEDKNLAILIPGCGNAYEAESLLQMGFKNITILDISAIAIKNLYAKFNFSRELKVVHEDFFYHQGQYDIIVEQTFFCALNPNLRKEYVIKMNDLLTENGLLIGLMFNINFPQPGPPFGGSKQEYRPLFETSFEIINFDETNMSIPASAENEIFIELKKKLH